MRTVTIINRELQPVINANAIPHIANLTSQPITVPYTISDIDSTTSQPVAHKPKSIDKSKSPCTIKNIYYPLGYALAVAQQNKRLRKEYMNGLELLKTFEMVNIKHVQLLNKLEHSKTISIKHTQLRKIIILGGFLWFQTTGGGFSKIDGETVALWDSAQHKELLNRWKISLEFMKTRSKQT
eukprot:271554_1